VGRSLFWYGKVDRSFGMERSITLFGMEKSIALLVSKGRSPLTTFLQAGDRSFGIERSIAIYYFFTGDGRSHFSHRKVDRPLQLFHWRRAIDLLASKARSPFTTFSRATGDRSFWHRAGRSPFTTFSQGRAIALFGMKRAIDFDRVKWSIAL